MYGVPYFSRFPTIVFPLAWKGGSSRCCQTECNSVYKKFANNLSRLDFQQTEQGLLWLSKKKFDQVQQLLEKAKSQPHKVAGDPSTETRN